VTGAAGPMPVGERINRFSGYVPGRQVSARRGLGTRCRVRSVAATS